MTNLDEKTEIWIATRHRFMDVADLYEMLGQPADFCGRDFIAKARKVRAYVEELDDKYDI